jgi:hypothetical protein
LHSNQYLCVISTIFTKMDVYYPARERVLGVVTPGWVREKTPTFYWKRCDTQPIA